MEEIHFHSTSMYGKELLQVLQLFLQSSSSNSFHLEAVLSFELRNSELSSKLHKMFEVQAFNSQSGKTVYKDTIKATFDAFYLEF
jgi:hypothetical protein